MRVLVYFLVIKADRSLRREIPRPSESARPIWVSKSLDTRSSKRARRSEPARPLVSESDSSLMRLRRRTKRIRCSGQKAQKNNSPMAFSAPSSNVRVHADVNESDCMRRQLIIAELREKFRNRSGSLNAAMLLRIQQVLQENHPSYSEEEIQEKANLLEAIQKNLLRHNNSLNLSDLSALELILNAPFMTSTEKCSKELETCLDDMNAALGRSKRSFPPSAIRRLRRVLK